MNISISLTKRNQEYYLQYYQMYSKEYLIWRSTIKSWERSLPSCNSRIRVLIMQVPIKVISAWKWILKWGCSHLKICWLLAIHQPMI